MFSKLQNRKRIFSMIVLAIFLIVIGIVNIFNDHHLAFAWPALVVGILLLGIGISRKSPSSGSSSTGSSFSLSDSSCSDGGGDCGGGD